jgi:hypothetical protein
MSQAHCLFPGRGTEFFQLWAGRRNFESDNIDYVSMFVRKDAEMLPECSTDVAPKA